jgi:hypothetical protein
MALSIDEMTGPAQAAWRRRAASCKFCAGRRKSAQLAGYGHPGDRGRAHPRRRCLESANAILPPQDRGSRSRRRAHILRSPISEKESAMRWIARLFRRKPPVLRNAERMVLCGTFFRM